MLNPHVRHDIVLDLFWDLWLSTLECTLVRYHGPKFSYFVIRHWVWLTWKFFYLNEVWKFLQVEVRVREGRAVNIHMFCARRPGLLLSTMRALDNLGLDIQQAVISCFNGFALDVFRAEVCFFFFFQSYCRHMKN